MLQRVLQPEANDSIELARNYDQMDLAKVNQAFVQDLLAFVAQDEAEDEIDVLDVGTGTAKIPIALCQQFDDCRVMAVDISVNMLDLGRYNIEAAGCIDRITLAQIDAQKMNLEADMFDVVMSNCLLHRMPEPLECLKEMVRVSCDEGGFLFVRDLMRPADETTVAELVQTCMAHENEQAQQMFESSLRAALSLDEIRELVVALGFTPETVQATTDQHWTWAAKYPEVL